MKKEILVVSVSGGRTSAYMAWWILQNWSDRYELYFVFANTGLEHRDTLRFLRDVNRYLLGGRLVMLEAKISPERGVGVSYTVMSDNELSIDGAPYEAVTAKHGVANKTFPHCTRELKQRPIKKWARDTFGKKPYTLAIGIRADEKHRLSKTGLADGRPVVYPLAQDHPVDSAHVLDWFNQFDWDLKIPSFLGNCVTCWKKSYLKLNAVWWDDPAHFEPFARYEEQYGLIKPVQDKTPGPRVFWRGYKTTPQLLGEFAEMNRDNRRSYQTEEEDTGACSESCEPFPTEDAA
jgi:hypothetical protein